MELVNLVSEYRVIAVAGADAQSFLQAQFTCDLNALPADAGCAGALLNPKGKVLAFGYLLPHDGHWLLLVHPEVAEQTVTHLSRYILRAKVDIGESHLFAVGLIHTDNAAGRSKANGFSVLPGNSANLFHLPDGRQLGVSASAAESLDVALWRVHDLRAGVVTVDGALQDRYIPQMLGLDVLGAVSFSKGCYPGQEIVARARHLGRVKRALALIESPMPLERGHELCDAAGKRVGEIIDGVQTGDGWLGHGVVNRDAPQVSGVSSSSVFE